MKWLCSFMIWIFSSLTCACELMFVSSEDANAVFMASNIASGLFFKSTCARTMKEPQAISADTKASMAAWNLSKSPEIRPLTNDEVQQAKMIFVLSIDEQRKLQDLYPNISQKIEVLSTCAGMTSTMNEKNHLALRGQLFRAEDMLSANGWKCLKN
ncbi:MAG: hypothetical protein EBY16_03990 [Gammaproteobacteria bacterium]|nr:hypothetical protein [Gammaproteobacteria bacterium]